jgi:multicomponent K+:H+ antiporter subunit G
VTLATIIYFSALQQSLALHAWLIIILLSLTVPVTTIMLARAALFRSRTNPPDEVEQPVPPALSKPS